jgi:hypothetical protein
MILTKDYSENGSLKGIKYISLFGANGYFISAKKYMLGFEKLNIPFTWTPLVRGKNRELEPFTGDSFGDAELDCHCNKPIEYDTVIIHTPPEYYPYWVENEKGKRIIGYTVWETDKLPAHWPQLLNLVDRVLVPCHWNREVFMKGGVRKPIDVIPHILEGCKPVSDCSKMPLDISPSDFVFYTIETWTARKAVWNTIRCYLDAFTGSDPVLLVVKTTKIAYNDYPLRRFNRLKTLTIIRKFFSLMTLISGKRQSKKSMNLIKDKYAFPARILLIDDTLTDEEIMMLHRRGDCYVSLCRSEGWGLGSFTAAGMGNPVIITGFGGHLDFLPGELAYLIDYDLTPARDDWDPRRFTKDQRWAEPKRSHASELMRHVFENQKEAKAHGEDLRRQVNEGFNEDKVMPRLISALVQAKIPQRDENDGINIPE